MKRKSIIFLTVASIICTILLSGLISSAAFGSGVAVVASEVEMVKTGLVGQKLRFSDADFKSALVTADFDSITVTKIPSSTDGTLLLDGRRVGEGKVIKRKNIATLSFIPASSSVSECSFTFTVDGAGSGEEIKCVMRFIDKINYSPKTEGTLSAVAMKTQENISLYGRMYGEDPEGDKLLYMVIAYPENGVLDVLDKECGSYCYTPNKDYTGEDGFTYVVRDEYGNYSYPRSVSINVSERMCDTVYNDMTNRTEYNAAVAMTAMNVMDGRLIGDGKYFMPDDTVSRAEFVAMAMKCAGIRTDSTLSVSYFDDDADIPAPLKCYVATAQRVGIINGNFENGVLTFSPNKAITRYEAAMIMAAVLGIEGGEEDAVYGTDETVPVWARGGVTAMYTLGVFDDAAGESLTGEVTRANAALYLYRMIDAI
ncbi:MAG: cadherin-like domain-containing protein [Clostridia bacterium]|nr:cadherin-like domain-containing protein [Clostridia bacterium]